MLHQGGAPALHVHSPLPAEVLATSSAVMSKLKNVASVALLQNNGYIFEF